MRLTGHLVAKTKRRICPNTSPHPVANQTKTLRPGATHRTCETCCKTKQESQDDHHARYTKYKSGQAEYNRPDSFELRCDVARHRGAAHPLCFTDEVMDHEFLEGFKPVNIEPYDVTTDPAVWIEIFFSTFTWPTAMTTCHQVPPTKTQETGSALDE